MMQRPPNDEDPTSEEEGIEFDGTHTDQLDDPYRFRLELHAEEAAHYARRGLSETTKYMDVRVMSIELGGGATTIAAETRSRLRCAQARSPCDGHLGHQAVLHGNLQAASVKSTLGPAPSPNPE